MPKNIVLCSDGTGNSANKGRGTNVFKLYEAVDIAGHLHGNVENQQLAFYDDGVGTDSFKLLKALGGAFGWGLSRNVRQLYTELCRCYKSGDRIYLFGFSRGAYTARMLAGFILACGILDHSLWNSDKNLKRLVKKAYRTYRKRYRTVISRFFRKLLGSDNSNTLIAEFKADCATKDNVSVPDGNVKIHFIGVWDTVDAVGLPIDELAGILNNVFYRFKFPDQVLSKDVQKACHAIAIDDERKTFHPVMWDNDPENPDRIQQVWFAGVHSNVGGGYPKQGVSLVSLDWMMKHAELAGLRFTKHYREQLHERQNIHDKLYNSRAGVAVYYRYAPRHIRNICLEHRVSPRIHQSTFERIEAGTNGYAPGNIPENLEVVNTPGAVTTIDGFDKKISEALGSRGRDLAKSNFWITLRRNSHYAFVIITIAVLLLPKLSNGSMPDDGLINTISDVLAAVGGAMFEKLLQPIAVEPLTGGIIVTLGILFFMIGRISKSKIHNFYSVFWRNFYNW